jgi:RimJ/RimL family protein N-acetyltransferase
VTPAALSSAPRLLLCERVVLRAAEPAFAGAFAQGIAASAASYTFVRGWLPATDVEVAARSLVTSQQLWDSGTDLVWHAFVRGPDEAPGQWVARVDLHSFDLDVPRCELGFIGNSGLSGRGLVREAVLSVLQVAWQLGLQRVQALCDARNTRAVAFAQSVGLRQEGLLRAYERDEDGALCDQVMLAALHPALAGGWQPGPAAQGPQVEAAPAPAPPPAPPPAPTRAHPPPVGPAPRL